MKLVYENRGEFGYITLTNPPQNTLTDPEFENREKLSDFLDTPSLKGIFVKGAGRHFSAGADLSSLKEGTASPRSRFEEKLRAGKALLHTLQNATVPTVAVIRGSCLGAGLEIALSCHFRFAARNALLGFPESDRGLLPGLGGTFRASRILGTGRAVELLLSGKMINGDEALELGIVDRTCRAKGVEEGAIGFLKRLVERRSTKAVRAVMTAILSASSLTREAALEKETELFLELARETNE